MEYLGLPFITKKIYMRKIALATHYTNNKKEIEQITQQAFPVSYSLFGGYRSNYNEVISLHLADTLELLELTK